MERVVVGGINVRFRGGNSNFDFILVLACLNNAEIRAHFVIAFRTPGDVMHIGKLSGKVNPSSADRNKYYLPRTRSRR